MTTGTLYKREGSPYYWLRFSHDGERYQESTGKTREDHAEIAMSKRIDQVKNGYPGIFANLLKAIDKLPSAERDGIRKELADKLLKGTAYEANKKPNIQLLISEAFKQYETYPHEKNPSKTTMQSYRAIWKLFTDWLTENHPEVQYMNEITNTMASRYLSHVNGRGITERTYNGYLKLLRSVFEKLKPQTGMTENPFSGFGQLALQTESREKLTADELQKIIQIAEGEMKSLILIGCYTGLRLKDVALLEWKSVNMEEREIRLVPSKVQKYAKGTKNKKKREVVLPIHSVLLTTLADIKKKSLGNSKYVLPETAAEYERYNPNISFAVRDLFEAAGLKVNYKREDGKGRAVCRYSYHSLRHSFVSLCHASGIPQSAAMEMVGHTSESVHMVYVDNDNEIKRRGIDQFPNLIGNGG